MNKWSTCLFSLLLAIMSIGCVNNFDSQRYEDNQEDLKIDPATGVPYAYVFQFPISGFDTSDFGFGYAGRNDRFCMDYKAGQCVAYGYHLGRDSLVGKTPYGTEVVAPADGIVRLTTDNKYGGYGSDSSSNASYRGCLLLLEHEFANGQPVITLLGHVQCEFDVGYDPITKTGNPQVGEIVRRGQYLGHIGHYWPGNSNVTDWHHLHWGMRRGAFNSSSVSSQVKGYAKKSEFVADPVSGALSHPDWLDPFIIVAANSDPALEASSEVRRHPSGSLLEDKYGQYWLVVSNSTISSISSDVMAADRFDRTRAVLVSETEIACYEQVDPIIAKGQAILYQRPGSSTVVMAYSKEHVRYDVIRWEALLSWGFESNDLISNQATIQDIEANYSAKGYRLLRPGTLVKADEESEVSIITMQQTRLPIASAEVFESLGFSWERIVSIPKSVLTEVAGPREDFQLVDLPFIHQCATPEPCPGGGDCGGGGDGGSDPGDQGQEICNGQDDDEDGEVDEIFLCELGSYGGICITECNTAGISICTAPSCSWGGCEPFSEDCNSTIDEDCNGLVDCDDPVCFADIHCNSTSGQSTVHFEYNGPATSGFIQLHAWWQPPAAATRSWGLVSECIDGISSDGKLDCVFNVPSGTSPFEFQVILPNGAFWGDESCSSLGGCGQTVGNVVVHADASLLPVSMVSNNTSGLPYYNGHISFIP